MMRRYILGIIFLMGLTSGPSFALENARYVTLHSGATADGDGTPIPVDGFNVLGLDIAITNTATVTVKGRSSLTGNYSDVNCHSRAANTSTSAATASANFQCSVSGLKDVKATISGCSSCTVSVKGQLTTASSIGGVSAAIDQLSIIWPGEDQANNVIRVEHQYSRGLAAGADTLIKTGSGYLHSLTCWGSDAAATAGDIAIRDAIGAGAGTVILDYQVAAALAVPQNWVLDIPFTTGLYIDFTTTADVTCTVSYR